MSKLCVSKKAIVNGEGPLLRLTSFMLNSLASRPQIGRMYPKGKLYSMITLIDDMGGHYIPYYKRKGGIQSRTAKVRVIGSHPNFGE